jgi:hypothetical protein
MIEFMINNALPVTIAALVFWKLTMAIFKNTESVTSDSRSTDEKTIAGEDTSEVAALYLRDL